MADDDTPATEVPATTPEQGAPAPPPTTAPPATTAPAPGRPPATERRPWRTGLVLVLALVVLVGVGLLAVHRYRATTVAPPVAVAPAPSGTPLKGAPEQPGTTLPGAGDAVVYLQTTTAIVRVALGSGATTSTVTPELTGTSDLLAGHGWVLSKAVGAAPGVLLADGGNAQLLPVPLQQAGRVYLAGPGTVWALPQQQVNGIRTALLLDQSGNRVGQSTVRVPAELGVPTGALAGSLVAVTGQGTYVAGTEGARRISRGVLLALGSDAALTWDCNTKGSCDARTNVTGKAPVYLPAARISLKGLYGGKVASTPARVGALSPDRRWVALDLPTPTRSGASVVLVDLRSGHRIEVPGTVPEGGGQLAWTPDARYLLALTEGRLRAVDTTTERVVTLGGTPGGLTHLAVAAPSTP